MTTKEQAQSFETYSVANAAQVKSALTCGCEPYQDVFTYGRWAAQGFQVQRGERAIRLPVMKSIVVRDETTGEERHVGKRPWTAFVFCRHQVAPRKERS